LSDVDKITFTGSFLIYSDKGFLIGW